MKLRKVISGILVVCLMVLFASCDAASILKMGEMMGKTENNIYGLKPNMAAVEKASSVVSEAVTKDEEGNIQVDLGKAAEVQDVVAEIGNSTKKTDELRKEMKKPVATTEEDHAKVKTQLEDKKAEVVTNATAAIEAIPDEAVPAEVKSALAQVVENIGAITVSDKPTQAELVSVAVVADLASTLTTEIQNAMENPEALNEAKLLEVYDKAVGAVETIKMVNDNEFDLLQGIDIAELLGMAGGEAKGLEDLAEPQQIIAKKGIKSLVSAIDGDKDGEITEAEFQSFISYLSFIRAAYETGGCSFRPVKFDMDPACKHGFAGIDEFLSPDNDKQDFTINDVQLYLVSVLFTEGEKFIASINDTMKFANSKLAALGDMLPEGVAYPEDNSLFKLIGGAQTPEQIVANFEKIGEAFVVPESLSALEQQVPELWKLLNSLPDLIVANYAGINPNGTDEEKYSQMLTMEKKIVNILNTTIVIAYKADLAKPIINQVVPQGEGRFDDILDGWFSGIEKGIQGR